MPIGVAGGVALGAAALGAGATVYSANKNAQTANQQMNQGETGPVVGAESQATSQAEGIATRAYTPYTGERVAPESQNEQAASSLANPNSANLSAANNDMTQASNLAGSTTSFDPNSYKQFMDPYTKSAIDPVAREATLTYNQNLNAQKAQSASQGALGGDRETLMESELARGHEQNISDIYSKGYAQAYNNAMSTAVDTWKSDTQRKLGASAAYANAGGDITKMNSQQISDLMATGQAGRLLQQTQLDTDYNNFLEKRDWSVTNLQPLLQTIGASKGGNYTQTRTQQGDTVGAVLGAASAVAGYFGKSSGSGTPSYSNTDSANLDSMVATQGNNLMDANQASIGPENIG